MPRFIAAVLTVLLSLLLQALGPYMVHVGLHGVGLVASAGDFFGHFIDYLLVGFGVATVLQQVKK
jgi:hypothetical protein